MWVRGEAWKKKEKKKNIQRICQLAFPSEKVIRLTAPKTPWEYKLLRRQEACSMTCKFYQPFCAFTREPLSICILLISLYICLTRAYYCVTPADYFTKELKTKLSFRFKPKTYIHWLIWMNLDAVCKPADCLSHELGEGICLQPVAQMTLPSSFHLRGEGSMIMSVRWKRGRETEGVILFMGRHVSKVSSGLNAQITCPNTTKYTLKKVDDIAAEVHDV